MFKCPLCDWVSTNKDDAKALKEQEMHLKYYHNQPNGTNNKPAGRNPEQSGMLPCPECGSPMIPSGGCWTCPSCGFDRCG